MQILIQGVHGQGKSQREITFFKAKELSGIFDISQGIFQFKPKSGNILKNRFIKYQTTMNTNILSPVACPYEHKTEVK